MGTGTRSGAAGTTQPAHLQALPERPGSAAGCSVSAAASRGSVEQRESACRPGPARSYKRLAEAIPGSGASRMYKRPCHANVPAAPPPGHGQQLQPHTEVPVLLLLGRTPLPHGAASLQQ